MSIANYLGYDPGGMVNGTGVALLTIGDGPVRCATGCVDSVDDALEWSSDKLSNHAPDAAGFDTYLFWETGRGGWRPADRWLRTQYDEVRDSIFCSNSARGSMAIQGMALAIRLQKCWPQVDLIETHPKVLYYALSGRRYDWRRRASDMTKWLLGQMDCASAEIFNDHCWDAAISAWAAFKGHTHCWPHNLRADSLDPIEPAGSCAYWWPK